MSTLLKKWFILNKISATEIEHQWVREWIHRLDQIEQKLNSPNRWWQGDNDINYLYLILSEKPVTSYLELPLQKR